MDLSALGDILVIGLMRGGLYVLMAMGLALVFGVMNIPNFAHGEFYMLGAFFAYFTYTLIGPNPYLCITIAAIGGFLFGVIVEKTCFYPLRQRSTGNWVMNSFIVTVGLNIALQSLVRMFFGSGYRGIDNYWAGALSIAGMNIPLDRVMAFAIAMVTVLIFWLFLMKTKTGNSIRAVADNESGAMMVGIDLNKIHTLTFGLTCMLAAIAGAALLAVTPAFPAMGLNPLYKSWFVVILVGLGNIGATFIGGFAVGLLETFSIYYFGAGWQDAISLTIIIIVLLFKPSGLFGKAVKGVWEK